MMSEVELTERLDRAIEAMLRNPQDVSPDDLEPTISELLRIALDLRHLPGADFKARLKDELEGEALMSTKAQTRKTESARSKIREGFSTVTPYLVVPDVHEEIAFITSTFGAEGKVYGLGSAGGVHSEYRIGDSMVVIGGGRQSSKMEGKAVAASVPGYVPEGGGL